MLPTEESIRYLSSEEVNKREDRRIDVRIEDAFEEEHLPLAKNFCVYEVAFADKVKEAIPDRKEGLILYGQNDAFKAAEAAVGRLREAGYENLYALKGGIDEWRSKGFEVEGSPPSEDEAKEAAVGRYVLDRDKTRARWIGRNLTNQHEGEIASESGWLEFDEEGKPVAGELTVDMRRITCSDIDDSDTSRALISHLSNADFFLVERYPTAKFAMGEMKELPDAPPGSPNVSVTGEMTIRGKTCSITFDAMLAEIDSGFVLQTQFDFDRTRFGAIYGSGKFFERLGMHLVNDLVNLQVTAFFERR